MYTNIPIPKKVINIYISYILNQWPRDLTRDFILDNCLFGSVKLTKNADPDKHRYAGYGIGFNFRSEFPLPGDVFFLLFFGGVGGSWLFFDYFFIIFGADMSSSVHIDNKGRDTLILGEGPTQELNDTTLTAEAKYAINFTQLRKRFALSLRYNGSDSFLFINITKIYQSKQKTLK